MESATVISADRVERAIGRLIQAAYDAGASTFDPGAWMPRIDRERKLVIDEITTATGLRFDADRMYGPAESA